MLNILYISLYRQESNEYNSIYFSMTWKQSHHDYPDKWAKGSSIADT